MAPHNNELESSMMMELWAGVTLSERSSMKGVLRVMKLRVEDLITKHINPDETRTPTRAVFGELLVKPEEIT